MNFHGTADSQYILVNEGHLCGPTICGFDYNEEGIFSTWEEAETAAMEIREENDNPDIRVYLIRRIIGGMPPRQCVLQEEQ